MAAVTVMVLAVPGEALTNGTTANVPPKTDPTGPNPLGAPTVEDAGAPAPTEDEQGPQEAAPEEPTVTLPDGTEAVADELIVNYGDGVAETPAGAPAPTGDQYGPEEEFCAIP